MKTGFDTEDFRVVPGKKVDLKKWPTKVRPLYASKKQYERLLESHISQLRDLQGRLYAGTGRYRLGG